MKTNISTSITVFLAAFAADIFTYATTASQLSLAFPIPSFSAALFKFMLVFAYTQIPLALAEAFLTVVIFEYILKLRPDILRSLKIIGPKKVKETI
jgi:cobalt/nickel transport system permease protein